MAVVGAAASVAAATEVATAAVTVGGCDVVGLIAGALCWMRLCGCYTPGLPELIRRISWVVRRRAVVSVPTSPSSHLWRS